MASGKTDKQENRSVAADRGPASPPEISLPKGGGAIRGIGEKFAANPVTGTGSMTLPIFTSPGRSGFGPQLSLSYDSGVGNGPFGFGWSLSLPSITRKTDKGLPRYQDGRGADQDSDVFILSGAEDLVPVLITNDDGLKHDFSSRQVDGIDYEIRGYRPRIEGLFARIERWTNLNSGEIHWRSVSKENITSWYGKTAESRIVDPQNSSRIFTWLICESYDDKGNVIAYSYKREDSMGVTLTVAHEKNRSVSRTSNLYLKTLRYGNHEPYLPQLTADKAWPVLPAGDKWYFEVVFDYGEHDADAPQPSDDPAISNSKTWPARTDPFSTYRAGFEVRTYRLCQRVLMFHHIPDALDAAGLTIEAYDGLVRSTDFTYSYEEKPEDARNPIFSFLLSIAQTGYMRQLADEAKEYFIKSLPPVEFTYSEANIQAEIREVNLESLENLPQGLDGSVYQWVDLDGEGIPGILTEQANAWFYKRNLSPIHTVRSGETARIDALFAPVELVASKPSLSLAGHAQFMDLAGDGQPDLVSFEGSVPGFYERMKNPGWETFRPFRFLPNIDTRDSNLKFIDLDGDGHSDILISEDEFFRWHPSLAEDGFGRSEYVHRSYDEEKGPALIFADPTQSIYLADMSGDGLTDLVRIRNGEVCYWPNLGYGHFGAKVTMDGSPWFDSSDLFNQAHIRLADIDGSGTTDIIYLHGSGVRIYFNQSGNGWSSPQTLPVFPNTNNLAAVQVLDLLGNGTACLVWSLPLPGEARRPMRYIDLMGGQKPHLLIKTANNLGMETAVSYAPSTRFYLADKLAGKPWITKLPFPVHCVEKITVSDKWRQTVFSTSYSYHHGYFDGPEREFRGFGRIEQVDVESYGIFAQGNSASPFITEDKRLYQPPVKTVTWYHTGAPFESGLSPFAHEYFPGWFDVLGTFRENMLPEPDLTEESLSCEEWREAMRACKGMMFRQEVYELDVDALESGAHIPVKLFTAASHNCQIRRLQAKELNRHAVFLVTESEAITYHHEWDLRSPRLPPDPRIAHTLNLQHDEYGNIRQSVAVVYPRLADLEDDALPADALSLIHFVQKQSHLAYTETCYTNDIIPVKVNQEMVNLDAHRLRVPCEVLTYELTGIDPKADDNPASPDPLHNDYFKIDELRRYRLSLVYQQSGAPVPEISYQALPKRTSPEKRLVEHVRMLFFKDDSTTLADPLELGELGSLGLLYETYKLALTADLLGLIFKNKLTNEVLEKIGDASISGYLSGPGLADRFPGIDTTGQYWIRSGIAGFAPDAAQHFYIPERYIDPFNNVTTLQYLLDLFLVSTADALGNTTRVKKFDARVLAPREISDVNSNLTEVIFDVLGLPAAMAVMGKGNEGDNLANFNDSLANPEPEDLENFFNADDYDEATARKWLGNASARHVYYFGEVETKLADGTMKTEWAQHPPCACGIVREKHLSQVTANEDSLLQASFEYSDGMGSVIVKKVQAEPEANSNTLRWVANGKTILNNKGKAVKQYEPYFSSSGHRFEEPVEEGVATVVYYDAVGRTVRTESPDGSYSRVEFSPWHAAAYDPNDTVKETGNAWFTLKSGATATTEEQRAAALAEKHAGTPTLTFLDSLGREVVSVVHNRILKDLNTDVLTDEKYVTFTQLDTEGKPLWIRDARKNLVMQYIMPPVPSNQAGDPTAFAPCYDIAGNLLYQHSMDAGERWMLNDAAGKPMLSWNGRGHAFRTEYDALHRPVGSLVRGADPDDATLEIQFEKIIYGDSTGNGLTDDRKNQLNIRGKPYEHRDTAGLVINTGRNAATGADEAYDFKGNLLRGSRQLLKDHKTTPDWSLNTSNPPGLESEIFSSSTRYDALNRPIQAIAPHSDRPGLKLNVIQPGYNEANLPERVDVWLEQNGEPAGLLDANTATQHIVKNIDYDAKGQRTLIQYGNGAETRYQYDPETFRLIQLFTRRAPSFSGLQNLHYTYDPVGNITEIRDDAQQTIYYNGQIMQPSSLYEYDPLYRLTSATGREHIGQNAPPQVNEDDSFRMNQPLPTEGSAMRNYTEKYVYDPVGNILKMIHAAGPAGSWTRRYDHESDSNRLRATSLPGDADAVFSAKYDYDAHGNMVSMPHLPMMKWDFKDQLSATSRQVVNATPPPDKVPETTFYVYDSAGQRVRKVTETQTGAIKDERIYLGGFEVYRKYAGGTVALERETLHVMDGKQRVALIETRTLNTQNTDPARRQLVRYQFGNHLGSASLELDDQAQVISYEEYYPYGSTSFQTVDKNIKAIAKRYRYTGKERDEENALYYHGARYYAPWLGRWINCDPIGIAGTLNMYEFARNNPAVLVDPSGLIGETAQDLQLPWPVSGPEKHVAVNLSAEQKKGVDENERTFAPIEKEMNRQADQKHAMTQYKDQHSTFQQGLGDSSRQVVSESVEAIGRAIKRGVNKVISDPIETIKEAPQTLSKAVTGAVTGVVEAGATFSREFAKGVFASSDYEAGVHAARAAAAAMQFTASVIGGIEQAKGVAPPERIPMLSSSNTSVGKVIGEADSLAGLSQGEIDAALNVPGSSNLMLQSPAPGVPIGNPSGAPGAILNPETGALQGSRFNKSESMMMNEHTSYTRTTSPGKTGDVATQIRVHTADPDQLLPPSSNSASGNTLNVIQGGRRLADDGKFYQWSTADDALRNRMHIRIHRN